MIELLAGILIGGTLVTIMWIRDLEHIRDHNWHVTAVLLSEIEREAGNKTGG